MLRSTSDTNYRGSGVFMHDAGGSNEWFSGRPYADSDNYVIARKSGIASHDGGSTAQIANTLFAILPSGNVGIGTTSPGYKLDVNGDLRITGTPYRTGGDIAWQVPSDARLKDITGPYKHGLDDLAQLDLIRFRYKENNPVDADTSREYTGVLAQDVQKVIPEAVNEDPKTGFLSLNTTPIFWAAINAIKDLYKRVLGIESHRVAQERQIASKADKATVDAKIQQLEAENAKLKAVAEKQMQENSKIKARLDIIEKMLNSK